MDHLTLGILLVIFVIISPHDCARSNEVNASDLETLFIKQLFRKYGNETAISFEALEHLFQNLEFGNIEITHRLSDHRDQSGFEPEHLDHEHKPVVKSEVKKIPHNHVHRRNVDVLQKCLHPKDLVQMFGFNIRDVITTEQFHHMCPVIMVQLESRICPHAHALHHQSSSTTNNTNNSMADTGGYQISAEAWGYGSVAILTISVLGLLSVSLIPCLQMVFLNTILQFLVSLAVGALSGDALLHLIPHVFGSESDNHDNVYKGLCALLGIYSFFIFGRIQGIFMNRKIKKETKSENLDDFTLNIEPKVQEDLLESVALKSVTENTTNGPNTSHEFEHEEQKEHNSHEHTSGHEHSHEHSGEHEQSHDHSGGHGHSHEVPRTLGALVWRVVIGDGIHNLSDGVAVGVAFASSITGGLSTSVAVLCHEIPHEMGDFAVLLKNGMTIKQAILCNCVSSVLSFIGMAVGLAIGNIGQSNSWIFAGIAGMFLYISLVDLIPEMSLLESGKREKRPFCQLLFQLCGTCLGIGIMFIIALFEDQLNSAFG